MTVRHAWGMAARPRKRWVALALIGAALVARGTPASAQSAAPDAALLAIDTAPRLRPGDAASVIVRVRVPAGADQPLLLTPSVQGQALEVVRGRLLREDASGNADGVLHFEIPLLAKLAGTALLRVELWTYQCQQRCESVRTTATKLLEVRAHSP